MSLQINWKILSNRGTNKIADRRRYLVSKLKQYKRQCRQDKILYDTPIVDVHFPEKEEQAMDKYLEDNTSDFCLWCYISQCLWIKIKTFNFRTSRLLQEQRNGLPDKSVKEPERINAQYDNFLILLIRGYSIKSFRQQDLTIPRYEGAQVPNLKFYLVIMIPSCIFKQVLPVDNSCRTIVIFSKNRASRGRLCRLFPLVALFSNIAFVIKTAHVNRNVMATTFPKSNLSFNITCRTVSNTNLIVYACHQNVWFVHRIFEGSWMVV